MQVLQRPSWLLSNTHWVTEIGELYRNLVEPVKVASINVRSKRASQLKQKAAALAHEAEGVVVAGSRLMIVGCRHVQHFVRQGLLRSHAPNEAVKEIRDLPGGCRLVVPPFASCWDGWCALRGHPTLVFDGDLCCVWRDQWREVVFSWDGMLVAYGAERDDKFEIVLFSTAGNFMAHKLEPTLKGNISLVAIVNSHCAVVTSNHQQGAVYLCRRVDVVSPWSSQHVCDLDWQATNSRCHILNAETILITQRCKANRVSMLVCLKTGTTEILPDRPGKVFWTPQLADLIENEAAYANAAVIAIDEHEGVNPGLGNNLSLVRAVLVDFVLEDAHSRLKATAAN